MRASIWSGRGYQCHPSDFCSPRPRKWLAECEGALSRIIEHDFLKQYEENPVKRWYKIQVEQDKFVAYSSIASFDEVFRVFFELVAECRALKGIAPWGSPAD